MLGDKPTVTRYDFDMCLHEIDGAPIYESAEGPLEYLEFRSLGIAVSLSNDRLQVEEIRYLSQPLGETSSRCKGRAQ